MINPLETALSPALRRIVDMAEAMIHAQERLPYRVRPLAMDGMVTLLVGRKGEHKSWLSLFALCWGAERRRVCRGPLHGGPGAVSGRGERPAALGAAVHDDGTQVRCVPGRGRHRHPPAR